MAETRPGRHEWMGHPVKCTHCGHDETWRNTAYLPLGFSEEGGLAARRRYPAFLCARCGHVEIFFDSKAPLS